MLFVSLAGVALGLFMVFDHRTREPGFFLALWWIPAVAAAAGILMRDPATFTIGALCFVVAGAVFALERRGSRKPARGVRTRSRDADEDRPLIKDMKHWLTDRARTRE